MEASTALKEINPDHQTAAAPAKSDGTENPKVIPTHLFVLDTTAKPGQGPREHQMIVDGLIKTYKFEPVTPLELPFAVAIKFLRIPEFIRTSKEGDALPYQRQPKQPHEMGAGEKFELADHQTVADYNELSNVALLQRALELPQGEMVPRDRKSLTEFIVKTYVERRKANAEKTAGAKKPDPEVELAEIAPIDED